MKNVRLKTLKLRNFKGIKELDIDFNLVDTNIYGKNATGKTTINDAFQWLLFGKDSSGSADFDVKTKTLNGEYIHNLDHSVEGVFEVNDSELSLKKVFKEKYTKKRGSSTEEFTGHTTDYFIDEVPKKKSEFDEMVDMVADKNIFQLITDPLFFNDDKRFNWKNRRNLLIDMCGDVSDEDVLNSSSELEELKPALIGFGKSVDDYRAVLKSKMQPINQELKNIPVRINEARLAIPELIKSVDHTQLDLLKEQIELKQKEKFSILNGGLIAEKEAELVRYKNRKLLINDERMSKNKLSDERAELETERNRLILDCNSLKMQIEAKLYEISLNEKRRDDLRKSYVDCNAMEYDETQNICPNCHQMLPFEQIEGFKEKFNIDKSNKLETINAEGSMLKTEFDKLSKEVEELESKLYQTEVQAKNINTNLNEIYTKYEKLENDFKADKAIRIEVVDKDIEKATLELEEIKKDNSSLIKKVEAEIQVLNDKKAYLEADIAKIMQKEQQERRIAELEAQEKKLSNEYQHLDRMLYLTDLFIKAKVSMLSDKINSYFRLCKFKLFNTQINGGIEECCEVTVNGVNYSDLNNAMKINAGLDCINTICDFKDTYAPIFIDNCEAVNETIRTNSQQIRLYVTNDERLRFEHE